MFNQIKVISLTIQLDVDPLSIYINISSSSFLTEVPEKPMTNSIREDKIVNKTDSNKICYQMLISLNCRWSHSQVCLSFPLLCLLYLAIKVIHRQWMALSGVSRPSFIPPQLVERLFAIIYDYYHFFCHPPE